MSLNSPKRSHSLVHHQQKQKQQHQHQQPQQTHQEEQHVNRLQPCIIQPPQRSSSVREHQPVRLARSSSLSHLSRKVPMRSKSLPQKPNGKLNEPLPPIPPFLFEDPEPLKPAIIPPTRSSSLHKPRRLKKNQQDDEITKALLEWKHKSVFKLWKMNDKIFGSIEDLIALKEDGDEQVENKARSLWAEDEECLPKKEIAAYIGKLDPFCHRVLKSYMDQFDFTGMALDEAFRKLCQKLYFKAEAQEIDRILEVFSHKFWSQNPDKQLYKNADVVYTITYSIMLLNTDLHLVKISSHAKMTSDLFCENTMSTVLEQKIALDDEHDMGVWKERLELCLKEIYASVKNQGVLQPISEDDAPKSFLKRMGSMTQRKKKGSSSSSSECQ
ncbi:Sec7 domain-containing protein [Mucor lusitanicus]